MAGKSAIEWTEMTWNPVTGCAKISQGCKHCYAERMAMRLQAMGVPQYRDGFKVTLAPQVLEQPRRWKKPRLVFVNSMSDLFHDAVPVSYIRKIFDVMRDTPQHTYQILTKRDERLVRVGRTLDWPPNVWMGVSVENQETVFRVDNLRRIEPAMRFLSVEPLIGPIKRVDLDGIDWVIVGGESGPGARRLRKSWVEDVRVSCTEQHVPFFFKQWGKASFNSDPGDPTISKEHPRHAKGGCQIDGMIYRELPRRIDLKAS